MAIKDRYNAAEPTYNDYFDWLSAVKNSKYKVAINIDEWLGWWKNSGKWSERGRGRLCYCMARIDIEEAFSLDNIHLIQIKDKVYPNRRK